MGATIERKRKASIMKLGIPKRNSKPFEESAHDRTYQVSLGSSVSFPLLRAWLTIVLMWLSAHHDIIIGE